MRCVSAREVRAAQRPCGRRRRQKAATSCSSRIRECRRCSISPYQHTLKAEPGEPGRGKRPVRRGQGEKSRRARAGRDANLRQGFERASLRSPPCKTRRTVVARGGKGGRGNIHFATSYDRAPRRAEPGEPGQELDVRFELKVLADVGLLRISKRGKEHVPFVRCRARVSPTIRSRRSFHISAWFRFRRTSISSSRTFQV